MPSVSSASRSFDRRFYHGARAVRLGSRQGPISRRYYRDMNIKFRHFAARNYFRTRKPRRKTLLAKIAWRAHRNMKRVHMSYRG